LIDTLPADYKNNIPNINGKGRLENYNKIIQALTKSGQLFLCKIQSLSQLIIYFYFPRSSFNMCMQFQCADSLYVFYPPMCQVVKETFLWFSVDSFK
jgi:hypothetical protein